MPNQAIEKSINIPESLIQKQGGIVVLPLGEYERLRGQDDFSLEDEQLLEKAKNDIKEGRLSSKEKVMSFLNS